MCDRSGRTLERPLHGGVAGDEPPDPHPHRCRRTRSKETAQAAVRPMRLRHVREQDREPSAGSEQLWRSEAE